MCVPPDDKDHLKYGLWITRCILLNTTNSWVTCVLWTPLGRHLWFHLQVGHLMKTLHSYWMWDAVVVGLVPHLGSWITSSLFCKIAVNSYYCCTLGPETHWYNAQSGCCRLEEVPCACARLLCLIPQLLCDILTFTNSKLDIDYYSIYDNDECQGQQRKKMFTFAFGSADNRQGAHAKNISWGRWYHLDMQHRWCSIVQTLYCYNTT